MINQLSTRFSRWREGLAPGAMNVTAASFLDWIGNGLYLAIIPVYLSVVNGVSAATYGAVVAVGAAVGFAVSVPIGGVADRLGPRTVLIGMEVASAAACLALAVSQQAVLIFLFVAILMMGDRTIAPLIQSMVGSLSGANKQVRTMALVRSTANAGVAIGGLGASVALAINSPLAFRIALAIDAATFVVTAGLIALAPAGGAPAAVQIKRIAGPWSIENRRFLAFSLINGLVGLHKPILLVGVPLWIVQSTRAPAVLVGVIFVMNALMSVFLQVPMSRGRETLHRAGSSLVQATVMVGVACLLFSVTGQLPRGAAVAVLLIAAFLLTLGELAQSAGGWGVSFALSPENRRSAYLAVFGLGNVVRDVGGPLLVSVLIGLSLPGWFVLAAVVFATGAAAWALLRSTPVSAEGTAG